LQDFSNRFVTPLRLRILGRAQFKSRNHFIQDSKGMKNRIPAYKVILIHLQVLVIRFEAHEARTNLVRQSPYSFWQLGAIVKRKPLPVGRHVLANPNI
jgi:hypothetical protein